MKLEAQPQPDLEVRTILSVIESLNKRRDLSKYSLEAARKDLRLAAEMAGTCENVRQVSNHSIQGPNGLIPLRLYLPVDGAKPYPVLIWFHGGGFILGDLESADGTCRALANGSGAAVVSVDYRLAPENDLMAGRTDCIAATHWVSEYGESLGLDPTRIAVGGDSAGGNLAAVVAQDCARQGMALALQVLVYPATDLRIDYSKHPCADGFMLTSEVMDWIKSHIPDDLTRPDPLLSPALARSVADVAPALVITAGCDPLREDGLRYVELLRSEGIPVASLHYPGQFHGFVTFDLILHAGRDALERIGRSLATAFAQPASRQVAARPHQLQAGRRKLTELHFDQLVVVRFMLDLNRALIRRVAMALSLPLPRHGQSVGGLLRRYRGAVEELS